MSARPARCVRGNKETNDGVFRTETPPSALEIGERF
jgi:hypothetical protein